MARHIACQTLLNGNPLKYGWLRRQDFLHQKVKWNLLKTIKWPKVFVVVDNCFLYMYNNEQSEKPSKFIHLFYATDVLTKFDTDTSECPWSFALVNQATHKGTTYLFAAASQKEMTEWVDVLKSQLQLARERGAKAAADQVGSQNIKADDSDDDSDDDYDKMQDASLKFRLDTLGRKFIKGNTTQTPAPPPLRTAESQPALPPTPEPAAYADRGMDEGRPSADKPQEKSGWGRQASEPGSLTGGTANHASNRTLPRVPPGAQQVMSLPSTKPVISLKGLKPLAPVAARLRSDDDGENDLEYTDMRDVGPRSPPSIKPQRPDVSKKPSMLVLPRVVRPGFTSETKEEENQYEAVPDVVADVAAAMWTGGAVEGHDLISRCAEDGVYLLRKSTQCKGQLTLVSHVGGVAKKYKINERAPGSNQFTLDVGKPDPRYFTGMSQLVGHYMKEPLPSPGHEVCLSKPFSKLTNQRY